MKMSKGIVDTNLLVYMNSSPKKDRIISFFENENVHLCLAEQVFLEFYSVITDGRRVDDPFEPKKTRELIQRYLNEGVFEVIRPNSETFMLFLEMIVGRSLKAGSIFDIYLAATAITNDVDIIYTENEKDFKDIKGLEVINPL